jgi:hypothetical protein
MDTGAYLATVAQVLPALMIVFALEGAAAFVLTSDDIEMVGNEGDSFARQLAATASVAFLVGEVAALSALLLAPSRGWILVILQVVTGIPTLLLVLLAAWTPMIAIDKLPYKARWGEKKGSETQSPG